jgi:uncharacterized protein (DUF1778 family)
MGKKRVGRPELKASERRGETFRFMATKEESAKIRSAAKAAGKTLSEFLRDVAIPK